MTFFSGTDSATLKDEGKDRNIFVSLIVNNDGHYTAGITRKVGYKAANVTTSYKTFGNVECTIESDNTDYIIEEIEWYDLKVYSPFTTMMDEIKPWTDEIMKAKKPIVMTTTNSYAKTPASTQKLATPIKSFYQPSYTPTLNGFGPDDSDDADWEYWLNEYHKDHKTMKSMSVDKKVVEDAVIRMVTGSMVATIKEGSKAKTMEWVRTKMMKAWQDACGTKEINDLRMFAESVANLVLDYHMWEHIDGNTDEAEANAYIQAIIDELKSYPQNDIVKQFIDSLELILADK